MDKLALMTVMATLSTQAAGCVVHTGDRDHGDGGHGADVATIAARWSLRNMSNGATTACPAGFGTVQLIAQAIDGNGDPVAEPIVDLFDCDARTGTSTDLPPDVYQVWLEVRSDDLTRLYAQSLSQVLDVRQADETFQTDVLNDGGYFQLSWDLVAASNNRPVACTDVVGLDRIRMVSTSVADAHRAYDDVRPCEDHATVTDGLLQGSYTVAIDAMAADRSVGKTMTLTSKPITGPNQVTDLGHVVIAIDGL